MAGAFPCLHAGGSEGMIMPASVVQPPVQQQDVVQTAPAAMAASKPVSHALADQGANFWLFSYEQTTRNAFDAIYSALRDIASIQHEPEFVALAQAISTQRLGYELPVDLLEKAWVEALDVRSLYAFCVFNTFMHVVNEQILLDARDSESVMAAKEFFESCGFHEVDISPSSDGRLKGLERFVLRLPRHAIRNTKAYAGGLFDVENDLKRWQRVELKKLRKGGLATDTRYLKVAVYNRSSLRPSESGCGPFRGNELAAAEAALERLNAFREAVRNSFPDQDIDILLLGLDTDTDALRIHVPDAEGSVSPYRYVDMLDAYHATLDMSDDQAYEALQQRIDQACVAEGWGKGAGPVATGMRRFITQLMITNISQIEYVGRFHGGAYSDFGHAERLMIVGENIESLQLRNFAYFSHLFTVEDGGSDIDFGVNVFRAINFSRGLPMPVVVHYRYDPKVQGSRQRAVSRCIKVRDALFARYPELHASNMLQCFMTVRSKASDAALEWIDEGVNAKVLQQVLS